MKRKIGAIIVILLVMLGTLGLAAYGSGVTVSRTTTGSTTDLNHPAAYLADGDLNTYWCLQANATQGWTEITLAKPTLIYGLKLTGSLGSATNLTVEYHSDGKWLPFTAATVTTIPADGRIDLSWDRAVTQTLRIRLTSNSYVSGYLSEVEVLGETAATLFHRLQPERITTDANTSPNAPACFLSDGNTYTSWRLCDSATSGTAVFAFPVVATLKNINLYCSSALSGDIILETFTNNTWQKIASIANQPTGWYRLDLSNNPITTDKVRLTVSGCSGTDTALSEVEFWGYGDFTGDTKQSIGAQSAITIAPSHNTVYSTITDGGIKVLYSSSNITALTNSIQHSLKLYNNGTNNLNLADVKLRYWYTNETAKQQVAQIYWSTVGAQNITTRFVTVENKTNADTYLELGFSATAGTLAPDGYVEIKLGLNASDWTSYNQQNDFSFVANTGYTNNPAYTGYINDNCAWGKEPEATVDNAVNLQFTKPTVTVLGNQAADGRLKVLCQSANTAATTNSLQTNLKFENTGYATLDLSKVKLRYWYTNDTQKQQVANIYWASCGTNKVKASFGTGAGTSGTADTYLELGFSDGTLEPGATVEIKLGLNVSDWTNYKQTNDYSFSSSLVYAENNKITGYIDAQLAWGIEPDTQPLFDNTTYRLELAFVGRLTEPAVIEVNNSKLKLKPTLTLNDRTIYCGQLVAAQLWDGVNYLRIQPFTTAVTLESAFITRHDLDGEYQVALEGLSDGLLLTPATPTATEWQLDQPLSLEEATVTTTDHSTARLYVWVNNNWTELTNYQNFEYGTRFTGPVTTSKVKLEAAGAIGELILKGSSVTNQAPTVRLCWPTSGADISLPGWASQSVVGMIDNPQATVKVNGNQVTVDGHYFTCPLSKIDATNGQTITLTATAQDAANRIGTANVTVTAGEYSDVKLDQADKTVYTAASSFTISGTVNNQPTQYQVNVAGTNATLNGNRFVTSVSLKEGLNLIEVQALKNNQLVKTFYRRVVRNSDALALTIQAPGDNSYFNTQTVKVTGTVKGLAPLQVIVNGVTATLSSNTYVATVTLTEGANKINVVAKDAFGKTTTQTITVNRDTSVPKISGVTPAEGTITANAAVTAIANISDNNTCWVTINGQVVNGNAGVYQAVLNLTDGNQTITVTAQDIAGNIATYTVHTLVDTVGPVNFTPVANVTGWTTNNKPIISFSTTDTGSGLDHYEISLNDGASLGVVTSPYQFTNALADGEMTVKVKAVDKAGNVTFSQVKVYIDTTPPNAPANFRPVPGNAKMVVKWDKPSSDTVEYRVERILNDATAQFTATDNNYTDSGLQNGVGIKYRVWAIDHAGNVGPATEWGEATTGLAEATYKPNEGAVVEYDKVLLCIPSTGVAADVAKVEVTEVKSEYLTKKADYPMISPIYEFSTVKTGETTAQESTTFDSGYLAQIEYDPASIPSGFPEENLGVYYYNPMFDRWVLTESLGVDTENNKIYFMTNHFSSFTVQATVFQDLAADEYKDAGYSPLKNYSQSEGISVSPQGGTVSTRATELVLPGRDGFDLVLARHYDTALARNDAFALSFSGGIGLNLISSTGVAKTSSQLKGFVDSINSIKNTANALTSWTNSELYQKVRDILEKYLYNQGDYAYSMGQGWRLNLPYMKAANSDLMFVTPDGAMHSLYEMDFTEGNGYTEGANTYRTLNFKQHEGDDFTIKVKQKSNAVIDIATILTSDKILKSNWYSMEYTVTMKDGTVYLLNGSGRVTQITDPSGKNAITFSYNGYLLDHITDSMGRVVKFSYDTTAAFPRITKMWVENDTYNRRVQYDVSGLGLLNKATDVNGRESTYDYNFELLYGGTVSAKVNVLDMIGKTILNYFSYGTLGSLLGDDINLSGSFQAEAVFAMNQMIAPGQGRVDIGYDKKTLTYGSTSKNYYKLWKVEILKSITYNGHIFQRLMADMVKVYAGNNGELTKTNNYSYDMKYHSYGQPFVASTVETDGRKKTVYTYNAVDKTRHSWNNNFGIGSFRLTQIVYRTDILSLNTKTAIYDVATNTLLETMDTEYDEDRMMPTKRTNTRGSNYNRVSYTYDDWGNVIYTEDYSNVNSRVNQTKTWSYYLGVSKPTSDVAWLSTPYSQPTLTQRRYNLPVGKTVANYTPSNDGEAVVYLQTYNKYNELGQLTASVQWDGNEWLQNQYQYHPTFGSIAKKTDAQGHETDYEYDTHGLPAAIIEKSVQNAKGETTDITTRTGYDYMSGWKLWQQNPNGFVTQYEYDALGRTTKIIAPDDDAGEQGWNPGASTLARDNNPTTKIEYDDTALSSLVTDANGGQIKYNFDKFGRLAQLTKWYADQDGKTKEAITTLGYDAWGDVTSITDPNGNDQGPTYKYTIWYTYDAMGRNTAIIHPDTTATQSDNPRKTLAFDYATNTLTTTDENGNITTTIEDMQGRAISETKTNDDATIVTSHYYDGLGNEVETVVAAPERTSKTTKTYSQLNLLTQINTPAETFLTNNQEVSLTPYQRFEYNKVGQKTAEISGSTAGERTTRYLPDELGRVFKTTVTYTDNGDSKQAITEIYYDANGNKTKVVDANNTSLAAASQKATSYTYTAADKVATETDPAGNTTSYTYDKVGNRLSMTDPRGNSGKYSGDYTIVYEYDALNRLVKGYLPKTDEQTEKPQVKLVYDARGNLIQRTEPDGLVISYTYAPRNRLTTETRTGGGKGYVITHTYDNVGNETKLTDARGYTTVKEYDAFNRLAKVTYPEQDGKVVEQYGYDEFNNRTSMTNGRGVKTAYSYDRYNRLSNITDALGGKTSYHYDTWGNLVQMENALGHATKYQYDELNRLVQETDSLGYNKLYRYDAVGNRVYSQDPNGTVGTYEYEQNNLLKQVTLTNGSTTKKVSYSYDEAGYKTKVSNNDVVTTYNTGSGSYLPDPFGRIRQESKSLGGKTYTVAYNYDVMGRMTGIKYPNGNLVNYNYNNLGELQSVPGYIDEAPSYDQGGLLVGLKAANGVATTLAYDQNSRLKDLKYANQGTVLKEYAYTFDGANNIKTKNSDSYEYDDLNQLLTANMKGMQEVTPERENRQIGRVTEDFSGENALEFTVADTDVIDLDYASGSIGLDLMADVPITRLELNPKSTSHRLTADQIQVYTSTDNATYTKQTGWALTKQTDGSLAIVLAQPITARYIKIRSLFDSRDQDFKLINDAEFINTAEKLVKVYYQAINRVEQYTYDKAGNRTSETITQQLASTRQYTYYPNSNRLQSNEKYTFEYDANGNLIKKTSANGETVWTYQYDFTNRLTQVAKNGVAVASYIYDESGLRLRKTGTSNGTTDYVFDTNGNVLYEQENRDYLEYIYVLGKHFARVDGNLDNSTVTKYFYHIDHLGSTVAVTDETGATVWTSDYTPFGARYAGEGKLAHAAKFTGKDWDEDTGLYYFNARWYDQEIGRFVEEDPIQSEWLEYFNEKGREQTERFVKVILDGEAKAGNDGKKVELVSEPQNLDELEGNNWYSIKNKNQVEQEQKTKISEESKIEIGRHKKHKLRNENGANWYWFNNNNPIINVDPDGYSSDSSAAKDAAGGLDAVFSYFTNTYQYLYVGTKGEIAPKPKSGVNHIEEMKKYHKMREDSKKDKYAGQTIGPASKDTVSEDEIKKRAKEWKDSMPDQTS